MNRDIEHLRLLSIFHYVVAGFCFLLSLLPVIILCLGVAILTGHLPDAAKSTDIPDAQFSGWIVVAFAVGLLFLVLVLTGCLALAGRFLSAKRHYTFCVVVAALSCFWMPFGTVLGVFSLVVLTRDSVKALFRSPPAAAGETA